MCPGSAKPGRVFPLKWFERLLGVLVAKICALRSKSEQLYRGMHVYSIDKSTLALPESPELWKKFGCHKSRHGLGNISAELCTVFCHSWRVPVSWSILKATSSEFRLAKPLINKLKKGSLLLLDNGFYALYLFKQILGRKSHFLIPMNKAARPKVIEQLGPGDYLCEIEGSDGKGTRGKKPERIKMTVRVIYVYRKGFRSRRLVTSLLDPMQYPAPELAEMYHQRWHIETFYRDFKIQMEGNSWHCKTVSSFYKELVSKFILITLTRLAMADASRRRKVLPGLLSFARASTSVKIFLYKFTQGIYSLDVLYEEMIQEIAKHVIRVRPGRFYSRDTQERRKKARGLTKGKVGRPRKKREFPEPVKIENLAGRLLG